MKRILLVENSPTQASAFGMLLEDAGLSVETATGGAAEAMQRLGQQPFDLILTTLTLPDQSGIDLCRSVKLSDEFKSIPVIILTTSTAPLDILNSLNAGADGFISKTREPDQIVAHVKQLLDRDHSNESSATTEISFRGTEYKLAISTEQILNVMISAIDDATSLTAQQADMNDQLELELKKRRQAEHELRAQNELYHSLVEQVPINMFRKDLNGRFTFANQLFCNDLGCSPADIIGKTDFDFFPKELAEKYRRNDQTVVEQDRTFDDVEQHHTPDGRRVFVHVMKFPVRDGNDRINGVQAVFWDVTNQTLADEESPDDYIPMDSSADQTQDESLSFLLAEDSVTNQLLAKAILTQQGHDVTVADNGKDAVELAANGEFDAILMDIEMPTLNGLDATRQIRIHEQSTGQHVPIIALTASSSEDDNRQCLEAGMNAVISKPIRMDSVVSLLAEINSKQD